MSDRVTLEPGAKVRSGKDTYKVLETAEVSAMLVEPARVQTNRHLAIVCPDVQCQSKQREALNGRLFILRGTRGAAARWLMPSCGNCGSLLVFQGDNVDPADDGAEGE